MAGNKGITGNWKISGLAALGAAALALPLAAALATPVDPTQPPAVEDAAAVVAPVAFATGSLGYTSAATAIVGIGGLA